MSLTGLVDPQHPAVEALLAELPQSYDSRGQAAPLAALCHCLAQWRFASRLGPTPYDKVYAEKSGNCIDLSSLACAVLRRLGLDRSFVLMGGERQSFPALPHAWTLTHLSQQNAWSLIDPRDFVPIQQSPAQIETDLVITAIFNDSSLIVSKADRAELWHDDTPIERIPSDSEYR